MERVCIIGAGSSGIAACQVLDARGITFDCFETGSQIGGNWRYLNDNGMSSAYRSLHSNTSKAMMEYPSFPMPRTLPDFPNHFQIAEYFDAYVDQFRLRDKIRFRTEVTRVAPADTGWDVSTRHRDTGATTTTRYRAVLVANGHHWDPRWPQPPFPGADTFTGEQIHSHHYKIPDAYRDKRVLVLGIGNSAADIAVELSTVAQRTFLAMRRSAHVLPKYFFGHPYDVLAKTPLTRLPLWGQRIILGALLRLTQGRVTDYGLPQPDHKPLHAHPTVSADLLSRLGHGDITVKPNVAHLEGDKVEFVDGSVERVDAIVYCTGYLISFPFLDLITANENRIGLYHRVADPDHDGLYFIGLVQPLGATMPLAEAQAHWVADLLGGTAVLPSHTRMDAEIARYQRWLARRYVSSQRHTIEVDFLAYQRELAKERRRGAARASRKRGSK